MRPAVAPVPASISRRQCARELFERDMITGEEMLAMTATATPPALVEAALAAMPGRDQWIARADFAADVYMRDNALLSGMMAAIGADAAAVDDFFRAAAGR